MKVDLRTCKVGQKLLTKHGTILTYVGLRESILSDDFPHEIEYPNGAGGTRTHNGQVSVHKRLPTDEDVVEILPLKPNPDYQLSFGIKRDMVLETLGYVKEGICHMDNGVSGNVYCLRSA